MRYSLFILIFAKVANTLSLMEPFVSRPSFLRQGLFLVSSFGIPSSWQSQTQSLELPLCFLPIAGCLAISVELSGQSMGDVTGSSGMDSDRTFFPYMAVIDTGSPFLTCPEKGARPFLSPAPTYPDTHEQYGQTIGSTSWREANLRMGGSLQGQFVVATSNEGLIAETGGLFLGLILRDDMRPSFLEQTPYRYFSISYPARRLVLSSKSLFQRDREAFKLFDLTPYGPNLHHYAIQCNRVEFYCSSDNAILPEAHRPIVVVIDTGLTGCVLSDSWKEDLSVSPDTITGMHIHLRDDLILRSDPTHWYLSCFRLPWFDDESNHPHIIAVGATFLSQSDITVDTVERRMQLKK